MKYGLIRDAALFDWLEANMPRLLARDPEAVAYAVERSCVNKAEVVAADEREGGVRATLNLGHTFGHAIETGCGYGTLLHGEAVSIGMVMAADMSVRLVSVAVLVGRASSRNPWLGADAIALGRSAGCPSLSLGLHERGLVCSHQSLWPCQTPGVCPP